MVGKYFQMRYCQYSLMRNIQRDPPTILIGAYFLNEMTLLSPSVRKNMIFLSAITIIACINLYGTYRMTLILKNDAAPYTQMSRSTEIAAVENILEELTIIGKPTIRVFNKEDRFSDKRILQNLCLRFGAIAISALNAETLPPLAERMETMINQTRPRISPVEAMSLPRDE